MATTMRPGAYSWGNHCNAWRPTHIHLSLLGLAFATRLVTQMYFLNDPGVEIDPITNSVPMPYRQRIVARFDIATCQPSWALGYIFDIVLKGAQARPFGDRRHDRSFLNEYHSTSDANRPRTSSIITT
jgi:protocatechuate 3,4-dioxygenase beta subunit